MNNKIIIKNYLLNLLTQLLNILIPMITTPYLARTIGADGIGRYSFTQSIVTLFLSFGVMGTSSFFSREIAYRISSKIECSKIFWEAIILKTITLFSSLLLYGIVLINQSYMYQVLLLAQIIDFFSELIDISWFFIAREMFHRIFLSNLIVKVTSVVLLFSYVKSIDDLVLYVLIISGCNMIGKILLWIGMNILKK